MDADEPYGFFCVLVLLVQGVFYEVGWIFERFKICIKVDKTEDYVLRGI